MDNLYQYVYGEVVEFIVEIQDRELDEEEARRVAHTIRRLTSSFIADHICNILT